MPQAQGEFVPAAGFLPNHRVDLECRESDSELFEEAQGTIELPLSQGSTMSTASTASSDTNNEHQKSDLESLMEAVKCERNELSNGAQRINRNLPQYSTSHTENMAVRLNPVTPTKPRDESCVDLDPLTPTANMKLLMSAVSPEIRNREKEQRKTEKQKKGQMTVEANNNYISAVPAQKGIKRKASHSEEVEEEDPQTSGRKEKSLGLLCQRFMNRYPEFPNPENRIEICLDAVAKELGVERRRIYDIVNVLESVEIMSRLAKNKYVWHGRTNLLTTLAKLKALGFEEGFHETIEKIKDYELSKDLQNIKKSPVNDDNARFENMMKESVRKDRSLGIMSQRFLMLFLVVKNETINLDLAAKILVGDPNIDKTESGKFKTQIRRLYDIANILTSLDLITKTQVTEVRGRKPAFKYVGPTVGDIAQTVPLTGYATAGPMRVTSTATRNSLLNGIQRQKLVGMLNNKTSLRRTMSQQVIKKDTSQHAINQKFSRHASFEMMCEIAEGERKRLYYESQTEKAVSQSQPTSPLKGKVTGLRGPVRTSDVLKAKQNLFSSLASDSPQSSPTVGRSAIKHYVIVNNSAASSQSSAVDSESSQESDASDSVSLSPSETMAVQTQGDQILLKAHLSHPNLPDKQPTLLKLSKAQIQSVLKSMSQNPSSTVSSSQYKVSPSSGLTTMHVQTQNGSQVQLLHVNKKEASAGHDELFSPPDVSRVRNRKRPLEEEEDSSAEECYFNAKRPKKDAESNHSTASQSPPLDSEVAAINGSHPLNKVANAAKPRPSPLRALHLEPEFQSTKQGEVSPTTQHSPILPVVTVSQQNPMAAPIQVPAGLIKRAGLMRSKSASPSTFMFGGRGVGSLQSEAPSVPVQQCAYISTTPTGIVSPLNGCPITPVSITTPGITAQVISADGYQITPTSSIRPSRNIVPSSGAILNLVPHLQSSTAQGESPAQNVTTVPVSALNTGGARILARHLSADQIMALRARQAQPQQPKVISVPIGGTNNIQAQTQFFRVNTQGIIQTPTQQQQFATQIISPSLNNTTPSTQLAASKSFFQSTPSGSLIRITTHQISPSDLVQQQQQQASAVSAFRVVNSQTFTPITETVTARRLTLTAEQTP